MKKKRQKPPQAVMIDPEDPLHEAMKKIPLEVLSRKFPPAQPHRKMSAHSTLGMSARKKARD